METQKNLEEQPLVEQPAIKRRWQKPELVQLPIRNTAVGATAAPEGTIGSPVGTQS